MDAMFQHVDDLAIRKACKEPDALEFVQEKAAELEQTQAEIDRMFTVTVGSRWRHRLVEHVAIEIVELWPDTVRVKPLSHLKSSFDLHLIDLMHFYAPESGSR